MYFFFFFNDTATTEIYTLSLHDALPISLRPEGVLGVRSWRIARIAWFNRPVVMRSEEHTSELQSLTNLVCRLLLEKKKKPRQLSNRPAMTTYVQRIGIAAGRRRDDRTEV